MTTISGISGSYQNLQLLIFGVTLDVSTIIRVAANGGNDADASGLEETTAYSTTSQALRLNQTGFTTGGFNSWVLDIYNYTSTTAYKPFALSGRYYAGGQKATSASGGYVTTSAITSIDIVVAGSNNATGGTCLIYGVK